MFMSWEKKFFFDVFSRDSFMKSSFSSLQEPVAFVGGMFAGLLRLDLNDDPLKDWVTRTVEAAGITEEEIKAEDSKSDEEVPEQIEIEWWDFGPPCFIFIYLHSVIATIH